MKRIFRFIIALALMIAIYSEVFMFLMDQEGQSENVDPTTAFYWVMTTITTLGYGDIVFNNDPGRLFSTVVALSGIFVLWAMALPMLVTPWFESISKIIPSKPRKAMTDHIIICGYSPIVESLTERLFILKTPFLIVERSEEVARTIYQRYPTILGDTSERQTLINAGIDSARLLIANEKEEMNAEVILSIRDISDIEVIALVDDLGRSRFISYAGASRVLSPKTLLGTFIAQITSPPGKPSSPAQYHSLEILSWLSSQFITARYSLEIPWQNII